VSFVSHTLGDQRILRLKMSKTLSESCSLTTTTYKKKTEKKRKINFNQQFRVFKTTENAKLRVDNTTHKKTSYNESENTQKKS
jgi:hypothetical protein